ncbi:MAG: 5-(carboxyamino)imidazole ribonucleotide synthase [Candidatus Eisenbacteria bacterium]|nr:5-(carboxyamino)imidazole ribonucleotide synthase [Candidatus Eisenbacteria bacterium]
MRIGVLGGGQLGRMLGLAGRPLGFTFTFLDPADECPAAIAGDVIRAPFDDPAALDRLAETSDVITWEFENVPEPSAMRLAESRAVHPPSRALGVSQNRLLEKQSFARLGIPVVRHAAAKDEAGTRRALETIGLPAVIKTQRMGYDGRGQRVVRAVADVAPAIAALGDAPLIVEAFVPFRRELSVIAVRSRRAEIACYPIVENHHADGILRRSLAPAPDLAPALAAAAERYARAVLEDLDYVGVLAIELFETDGGLLANEMAPRVHNSGHWSIEGAETSQFENHLRAISGLPLGATAARGVSAMVNLIGTMPDLALLLAAPGAHVHLYGKTPRPGRKLGHVTLRADDRTALARALEALPV